MRNVKQHTFFSRKIISFYKSIPINYLINSSRHELCLLFVTNSSSSLDGFKTCQSANLFRLPNSSFLLLQFPTIEVKNELSVSD